MPIVTWIHCDPDPLASGELRRLGIAALAIEGGAWRSSFVRADEVAAAVAGDIVVAPLAALSVVSALSVGDAVRVIVEVDDGAAADADALAVLAAMSSRLSSVIVRGHFARAQVEAALAGSAPIHLIPDVAETLPELAAAGLRFAKRTPSPQTAALPEGCELWFADAGDVVEAWEVAELARMWREPSSLPRLAVADPATLEWLAQSGVAAKVHASGPAAVALALAHSRSCAVPLRDAGSSVRRLRKAQRHGVSAGPSMTAAAAACDPKAVGEAWRRVLAAAAARGASTGEGELGILLFLDLVQDLDLALPLLDEIIQQPGVRLRVVLSTWLEERSPRVMAELDARGLTPERLTRLAVLQGSGPQLDRVDAVICVVETSDPAHARSHALVKRARAQAIPTFSLQHGLENVGLTMFAGGEGDRTILSDHVLVWFSRENTPPVTPAALRPRLAHFGRPRQEARSNEVRAIFDGFGRLAAVFENLHWERYTQAFRRRFLDDCVEFAMAYPDTAVLLKPHHAGMWTSRNRASISQWSPNLVLADPSDPLWEPFTAPSLIAAADLVITTPSTVALDAALARKPVAVAAYGMDLPAFEPLPLLQGGSDWIEFGRDAAPAAGALDRARFVNRSTLSGPAEKEAVAFLLAMAREGRGRRGASDRSPGSRAFG